MSPAPSRRLLPALAASLGAHGLLWLLVEGTTREVRPPPAPRPSTLEWADVEVAVAPKATVPEPERQEPPRTAEPPPSAAQAKPPQARTEVKPPAAPPEPPPRIAEAPPPPPASEPPPAKAQPPPTTVAEARPDSPLLSTDLPRAEPPRADLFPSDLPRAEAPRADLFPSDLPRAEPTGSRLLLAARETGMPVSPRGPVAELDAGVPDPGAPPSAQELVQDLVSEGLGRGRVERGLVHPYFSQLGKALMKAWDADRSVKEHGLQGYFDMGMERGRAYSRIWMERAEHYGASGSFARKDVPEQDRRRPVSTVGDPQLQARRELRQQLREELRATRRAIIRVVQDGEGRLLDVQLVSPSHQPEVDKEALKDVRAAAEKLPPPPREATGGRERITSLWQFELIISISPPIPSFTFEFDEALGFIDTRLPLDRRIYKRVRLLEVR